MEHNPPPNIPENYKVWAKISNGDREYSVQCKIFLPKTILETPQVYIFPEPKQFNILPRLKGNLRFTATKGDPPHIEIVGDDVHISGGSMHHWGEGLEEGYLKIYPSRLLIKHLDRTKSDNIILFRLTPSLHLSPWDLRQYFCNGDAKIKHGDRFRFKLKDDFIITFKNHYTWHELESKKTVTFSELVAEASFIQPILESDIDYYLSIFDDFLLLVSLAEGQRCMVPKLDICSKGKFTEIYRLDRTLPNILSKHSFNDFVIDTKHFEDFLNNAWKIYRESKQHELIKTALEINTNDAHMTMESHYLALFSSIETLILAFRKEEGLEYIINENSNWKTFKDKAKNFVKINDYFQKDRNRRALMYQNINGLNRIPLQYAFNKLVAKKKVDLNDLWPFSSEKGDWSLTTIRNRLIHGYGLNENFIDGFAKALDNLEFYAKRLLLADLGWDFNNSNFFRRDDEFIKSWKEAQEDIKNWK